MTLTVSGGGTSPVTYGTVGGNGTITSNASTATNTIALTGDWIFSGSFSGSHLTVTFNSTSVDQSISGALSCRVFTMAKSSTTLHLAITPTVSTTTTLTSGNVDYDGGAQSTLAANHPGDVTLSGSGAKTSSTSLKTITGTLTLSGTATATTTVGLTISTNLVVNSGTTFTAAGFALTVTGATTVDGTLNVSSTTGTKKFTGLVTINTDGTWDNSINSAITLEGGLTNDGIFTSGTGKYTLSTNSQSFGGTSAINFDGSVAVTGAITVTNNTTVTITGSLTGSVAGSTWLNAANSTFNAGAAVLATGTLTATATGNTVNYTGASQTLKVASYYNLTLSGGPETFGAITTIGGNLTLSDTATATTKAALTISGKLNVGSGTTFATGTTNTWTLTVTGATSVTGTLTLANTATKTFTGDVTINSGGVWDETGASTYSFAGNFTNNATSFTASSGLHTFSGSSMTISGSTTTSIANVEVTGSYTNTRTLTVSTALSGTGTLTNNGTLNIGGTSTVTTLTATASGNTVNYNGTGTQTVLNTNYYNLAISGSRTTNSVTIDGSIGIAGSFTNSASFSTGNYVLTGSMIAYDGAGQLVIALPVAYVNLTLSGSGTKTASASITGSGTLTNSATFDMAGFTLTAGTISNSGGKIRFSGTSNGHAVGTGTVEYYGSGQTVTSGTYDSLTINQSSGNAVLGGATTVNGTLALASGNLTAASGVTLTIDGTINAGTDSVLGAGNFTLASGATLKTANVSGVNGSVGVSGTVSISSGANFEFDGSSAQVTGTLLPATIHNLTINNSTGVTLSQSTSVTGTLTMTAGDLATTETYSLSLPSGAAVSGEGSGHYVVGKLIMDEAVGTSASSNLNTVGVSINSGSDNLGTVEVTRLSGTAGAITVGGKSGINRSWTITSDNPPTGGRTLTLSWVSDDDNGKNLSAMQVWKSTNAGTTWLAVGGTQNSSSRSVSVSSTSFSEWTVSDVDHSLPVQASEFSAIANSNSIEISWKTQSEVNNAGFNVLKMTPDDPAWELIAGYKSDVGLRGLGTSPTGRSYEFTDMKVQSGTLYEYKIQSVSTSGAVEDLSTISVTANVPRAYALYQNYPNPFNPTTVISYQLSAVSHVTLEVYDVLGREIATLVDGQQNAGAYKVNFDGAIYPSGVYFYRIDAVGVNGKRYVAIKKLMLMK